MNENRLGPPSVAHTAKEVNAARKEVTVLLDELAPERIVRRIERISGPIEQYRTPSGCVLQAGSAAVTVSWFAPSDREPTLGELRIIVWRGQVARRGALQAAANATPVAEFILHPIETADSRIVWRSPEGAEYDTAALAARCLAALQEQIVAS